MSKKLLFATGLILTIQSGFALGAGSPNRQLLACQAKANNDLAITSFELYGTHTSQSNGDNIKLGELVSIIGIEPKDSDKLLSINFEDYGVVSASRQISANLHIQGSKMTLQAQGNMGLLKTEAGETAELFDCKNVFSPVVEKKTSGFFQRW